MPTGGGNTVDWLLLRLQLPEPYRRPSGGVQQREGSNLEQGTRATGGPAGVFTEGQ